MRKNRFKELARLLVLFAVVIFVAGCGGELPTDLVGNQGVDIEGTASILGMLDIPGSVTSLSRTSSSLAAGGVLAASDFTIACGDATATVNADGTWKLSGVTPGTNVVIRAVADNVEFTATIAEVFANQVIANARVNSATTAENMIRTQLAASLPGAAAVTPLREDVLALAEELETCIAEKRHLAADISQLEQTRTLLEKAVTKTLQHGSQGIHKGTIEVWRLTQTLPEAADYDLDGDGFLSIEEFAQLRQFISLALPESDEVSIMPVFWESVQQRGVSISDLLSFSETISVGDADQDGFLTSHELDKAICSLMGYVQVISVSSQEAQETLAGLSTSSQGTVVSGSASLPTETMLAVAQAPELFVPNPTDDPEVFDQKLSGFIVALEKMTQNRQGLQKFSMGTVETEVKAQTISYSIGLVETVDQSQDSSGQAASSSTALAATSDQGISLQELLAKYPGAASLDRDNNGILTGKELETLRFIIRDYAKSGDSDTDGDELQAPPLPMVSVEDLMLILENAASRDSDSDGYISLEELSELAADMRACLSM